MARIYTRTGDDGRTSLADGSRTRKSSPRVSLYGEVDELNSVLGCCLAHLPAAAPRDSGAAAAPDPDLRAMLTRIQDELLQLGALLADPGRCRDEAALPPAQQLFAGERLEGMIDALERGLAPLKAFILPGGTAAAGWLHLARTVCRRAERGAVALAEDDVLPAGVVVYLNRLSDFLFTAARAANAAAGVADVLWRSPGKD